MKITKGNQKGGFYNLERILIDIMLKKLNR